MIVNTAGNVNAQQFDFSHMWQSPLGPPAPEHFAQIAGHFDNITGTVNGTRLQWGADVHNLGGDVENIMSGVIPEKGFNVSGPAPIPFADEGGPVTILTPIRHSILLNSYLDSPGDSIVIGEGESFDVEAIPIPEPAAALLAAVAVAFGLADRRGRPQPYSPAFTHGCAVAMGGRGSGSIHEGQHIWHPEWNHSV
jgi:hypothetical protein